MSYSFEFYELTKAAAIAKAAEKFDQCAQGQPQYHGLDLPQERDNAVKRIEVLQEPKEGQAIRVCAYGSSSAEWIDGKMTHLTSFENHLIVQMAPAPSVGS